MKPGDIHYHVHKSHHLSLLTHRNPFHVIASYFLFRSILIISSAHRSSQRSIPFWFPHPNSSHAYCITQTHASTPAQSHPTMCHTLQPREASRTPALHGSSITAYNFGMSVNERFRALTAVVDRLVASPGLLPQVVDEFSEFRRNLLPPSSGWHSGSRAR